MDSIVELLASAPKEKLNDMMKVYANQTPDFINKVKENMSKMDMHPKCITCGKPYTGHDFQYIKTKFANSSHITCSNNCLMDYISKKTCPMMDEEAYKYMMQKMSQAQKERLLKIGDYDKCCIIDCKNDASEVMRQISDEVADKNWSLSFPVCSKMHRSMVQKLVEEAIKELYGMIGMEPEVKSERVKTCDYCKEREKKLLKCSQCGLAYYCDQKCQRNDWKKHKTVCKPDSANKLPSIRNVKEKETYTEEEQKIINMGNQLIAQKDKINEEYDKITKLMLKYHPDRADILNMHNQNLPLGMKAYTINNFNGLRIFKDINKLGRCQVCKKKCPNFKMIYYREVIVKSLFLCSLTCLKSYAKNLGKNNDQEEQAILDSLKGHFKCAVLDCRKAVVDNRTVKLDDWILNISNCGDEHKKMVDEMLDKLEEEIVYTVGEKLYR